MSTLDALRYYVALIVVVTTPGALLFWFPIHPLANFWRRAGYRWAYVAGFGVYTFTCVLAWMWRRPLLAIEFGANTYVMGAGVALIVTTAAMRRSWSRQLSIRTLFGLPEVAPDRYPGRLLTEGAYARVRHPRYLQILVGLLGYALLSNYLAAYVVWAFVAIATALLIPLEERELAARFGADYEEYRRRVPALMPRLKARIAEPV